MTQGTKPFNLEQDALQELVNIGGGHAATSLSKLVGKTIQMDIPTVEEMSYDEIYTNIRAEDEVVDAIAMKLLGDEEGLFLFVMSEESSADWARLLFNGEDILNKELTDSALKELVNIVVHSFLNAVIQLIGVNLLSSVPILINDMFGSIFSSLYMDQNQFESQVVIIKTAFYCEGEQIEGSLFFVPKPEVIDKVTKRLGI